MTSTRQPFVGAILTGGASTRMGRDKALLSVEGVPLAARLARVLRSAGASEVFTVGGNHEALAALELRHVPDETPHEGPLGGILAALNAATEEAVVIVACDMPWIEVHDVERLVAAMGSVDVLLSAAQGQLQPLLSVWSRTSRGRLSELFARGERSAQRAANTLTTKVVDLGAGRWSQDLDTPADYERATRRRPDVGDVDTPQPESAP